MAENAALASRGLGEPIFVPAPATRVSVCEAWLRDGIQSWPDLISTDSKIEMLRLIAAAGVKELDVTSFVSKRLVPQFNDAEVVLAAANGLIDARVLTVNVDGARRVVTAHREYGRIARCGMPFSASEPHNLANLRRNHAQHREQVSQMIDILLDAGIAPLLGVVTSFGCPIQGRVDPDQVFSIAEWGYSRGVKVMMFSDTTGMGNPRTVAAIFSEARSRWPDVGLIAHFHDNRGAGILNTVAAIAAGAQTVDCCLGGVGGEPKAIDLGLTGDQGNVVTEDLVAILSEMGIETGLDPRAIVAAGARAEEILGRKLLSRIQRAGLIGSP